MILQEFRMIRLIWCADRATGQVEVSVTGRPAKNGIIHAAGYRITGSNHYYQRASIYPMAFSVQSKLMCQGFPGCSQILPRICA